MVLIVDVSSAEDTMYSKLAAIKHKTIFVNLPEIDEFLTHQYPLALFEQAKFSAGHFTTVVKCGRH